MRQAIIQAVGDHVPPTPARSPAAVAHLLATPHQLAVRLPLFGLGAVLFAATVAWADVHRVVQPLRDLPCDGDAAGWAMANPGYMSGYITVVPA